MNPLKSVEQTDTLDAHMPKKKIYNPEYLEAIELVRNKLDVYDWVIVANALQLQGHDIDNDQLGRIARGDVVKPGVRFLKPLLAYFYPGVEFNIERELKP